MNLPRRWRRGPVHHPEPVRVEELQMLLGGLQLGAQHQEPVGPPLARLIGLQGRGGRESESGAADGHAEGVESLGTAYALQSGNMLSDSYTFQQEHVTGTVFILCAQSLPCQRPP